MAEMQFGLVCLFSARGFNLQKEVTAGGSANWDGARWESSTLEYESLQIQLPWYHPSPSTHLLPSTPPNPLFI